MASIGITVYGLRVQSKQNHAHYLLNQTNGINLIGIVNGFINAHTQQYHNHNQREKIFKIENYNTGAYVDDNNIELFDYVSGLVKTGAYGYEAEIVDTATGSVNHNKQTTEAEVMPFYFSIAIPRGETDRSIIIFQNYGVFGIKSVFQDLFQTYLTTLDTDYKAIIGTIAPREYIDRYLTNGNLQKISFIRYEIPHDTAQQIGLNQGVNPYDEYIVHKPSGFLARRGRELRECIMGQRAINHIIELEDFEYNNVKLEFKLGRKNKVINLQRINNILVNEDITDRVQLLGGHPTRESIEPVILETQAEYLSHMGLI